MGLGRARRDAAVVAALASGKSISETARIAGLTEQGLLRRLRYPQIALGVELSRPACHVCRGYGVCACASCRARHLEARLGRRSIADLITPTAGGQQAVTHDGRSCHRCWGLGRSPFVALELRHETTRPDYKRLRRAVIDEWVAEHGPECPGFQRSAHMVDASYLTLDHFVSLFQGGDASNRDNLRVLCRSCNSRKSRSKPTADGEQTPAIGPEAVSLGAKLRAAREAMGYDLAELARRTRFSVVFLEAAEAGEIALRPDHLERIRWWLGMVPPYLRVPPPEQESRPR